MIRSMTGFGRRQGSWQDETVIAEIRSVNHRFLEVSIRVPKSMAMMEDCFKKAIRQRCNRGRIDLTVLMQGRGNVGSVRLDAGLAKQYHQTLCTLQHTLKLGGSIDIGLLAGFRDVIALSEHPVDEPKLAKMVEKLGLQALQDLVKMRQREGALLAHDLLDRIDVLHGFKAKIASRAPAVAQEMWDRMKARVEKLMGSAIPDLPRLNQELAIYADRSDITEELVRLDAHMIQFKHTIRSAEPVGKTLDFLVQEMSREVNTIGSKANDVMIAASVVCMKAELERVREQIQNVE